MEIISQNIPRVFTILAEMLSCMVYVSLYKERKEFKHIFLCTLCFAIVEVAYLKVSDSIQQWFWPIHMIILFVIMLIYLKATINRSWQTMIYCTTKAFIAAEFIAAFEWQFNFFYEWNQKFDMFTQSVIAFAFYIVCLVALYFFESYWGRDSRHIEISIQEDIIAGAIVVVVFILSNIGFFLDNTPFSGGTINDLFSIRTISDFMGLVLLFAFQSRIAQIEMRNALAILDRNLREQYNKYRNYQDSINLINMKYHDLRHQMENLKEQTDVADSEKMLLINNIESELREYRPYFQTGNDVLNALLDSRRSLWNNNQITITAVADGKILEFMNVADICSVIGNALDNAMESVCMIDRVDKRLIHIEIGEQKNFVMIVVENTCEQKVKFENGLPKTSHKDTKNHGYGTQSILTVVKKYGGTVVFDQKDDWFSMKILLPAK
ncbi:MAG: GHKL domain-containing protein [Pseudobutyrivibrio sp.]|nr:GHKL domain-containing protein [Pseudobutyrivibrio sp.]